jgi:hypothetical protein
VPFELGRPLGVPGDAAFQTRVVRAALDLLEAFSGPVLADYPEDVPEDMEAPAALVCPVNFATPEAELSATEQLRASLQQEIALFRSWYDLAVSTRGRTTVGVSALTPEEMGDFIGGFLDGTVPSAPRQNVPLAELFKFAAEDLKAYYCEAMTAQPSQSTVSSTALADWFWRETTAGRVLFAVQQTCLASDRPELRQVAERALIPRARAAESPYQKV